MSVLNKLQGALDQLIAQEKLNPENGDCLDVAVLAAMAAHKLGFDAEIAILQRYDSEGQAAVIHAVCQVGDDVVLAWSESRMNDLGEHQEYLESEDQSDIERAYFDDDSDLAEELAERYYEIDTISIASSLESNFEYLREEFKSFNKNNRKDEPLFNLDTVQRLAGILGSLVEQPKSKFSKKSSLSM